MNLNPSNFNDQIDAPTDTSKEKKEDHDPDRYQDPDNEVNYY